MRRRRWKKRAVSAACVIAAAGGPSGYATTLFGCSRTPSAANEATDSGEEDAGLAVDAGSADDAGDSADPFECPPTVPVDGTDCTSPGLWCEFDGGAHERCAARAVCALKSGQQGAIQWTVFAADPSCGPNAAVCPANFGDLLGATCPVTAGTCDYDNGRCACVECIETDGGLHAMRWACRRWDNVNAYLGDGGPANIAGACPAERPRLGTECTSADIVCGYDACYGVSLGPYLTCEDGRWAVGPQTDLCNPAACP